MERTETTPAHTRINLGDVEDSAAAHGFGAHQESRFATRDLGAERTGVGFHRVKAGRRQAFAHRHDEAEEVYVVLGGSGRAKVEDEVFELTRLDAIRVSPGAARSFEGGPDGLELIVFGQRHEGDGEILQGWWPED
ncbi:cupin domain-containing protein [Conexibacter woesei]|uniref:Cupin 2 conserved barrel domain protein n=1 Tax=Conexibacter woesei (strain DSM 14684 / CCUG 47730 / CIP 108061 / JCM 11494 / NBRC 100937 / ID131577) TaxID=469383 RepID=D3EZK1_CONWI|nr:cupin [Conexibacter woesei]ADB53839.1 Cupin 2 conserved barrel domain protein [Conexibacter woesei DSM 14684]